ncbi:MAG: 30S ribosomal protein S3 [Candidatus Omnitrophica bacterium]|nr:30S ribosomal protein S3 [Candidatus Omnitrophota bacterium]
MGHKVSPLLLRIGFIRQWHSRWFAKTKDFPLFIQQDFKIRKFIKSKFKQAAISKIVIERLAERIKIRIFSARPGIIIGRHGSDIERLRSDLNGLVKNELSIDIQEVNNPAWDAQLVAENIALQQEKRIAFRRAVKRAMEQSIQSGVKGIRVSCSGRLNGAEMSRKETYKIGKVPLQTLRADIDYGFAEALTTYGLIGVKVWIYKGDILGKQFVQEEVRSAQAGQPKEAFKPARQDIAR